MTAAFISPAPWTVNASGGARTIVARDRSVVAVVMGCDSAAPFDVGNGALMAAAPDLLAACRLIIECSTYWANTFAGEQRALEAAVAAVAKVDGR